MTERKTQRLSFPDLENQLKKTRMMNTLYAEEAIDDARSSHEEELFKDSCIEDAITYEILEDESVYKDWNLEPKNGKTLIKATFQPQKISEHFHNHQESLRVVEGKVSFTIKGVDIVLGAGGQVGIPSHSFHECAFTEETVAVVCLPTEYVLKNL